MASRIKTARKERGWSQTRLIGELERVAARSGETLPSRESLKSRVSRWENNHAKPDEFYRQLLREALGMDDRELGFDVEYDGPVAAAAEELRARLTTDARGDDTLLETLMAQTEAVRRQDRQYGAGSLLEQMRCHVANVEQHLAHSVFDTARRPLAQVLADASALAGWQAFDVGAVDQAWRFFELASRAASHAEDPALHAFARMEQAHVLAELTQPATAAELADSVWERAQARVDPPMQCWMAAATAEMHARAGDVRGSLEMLERAESRAETLDGESPPYLVFNGNHLDRWAGHTLAILEHDAAEQRLRSADGGMDSSFTRATASLNLDLASVLLRKGEVEEAEARIQRAEELARRVGSRRQLTRVKDLRSAS